MAKGLGLSVTHRIITIPQVYGSLPGPNQLGSYLLVFLFLVWSRSIEPRRILIGAALVLLVLTFSRGAALGLVAALMTGVVIAPRMWRWQTLMVVLVAVIGIWVLVSFLFQGYIRDIFTHGASLSEHVEAFRDGVSEIRQDGTPFSIVLGHGAGEAGPATFTRQSGRIQESWILQVVYEYGLVGGFLYGLIFWFTIKEAVKGKNYALAMITVGLLANAVFLHIFSDNPAVTTLYFASVALLNTEPLLSKKSYEPKPT
jgi:hypothetical protein